MRQPSSRGPTRCSSGTNTSVKNTSLNSVSSVIWRSGRTSTPARVHVDDERGDALRLRDVEVRAGEAPTPIRELRVARPDLLPVEHVAAVDGIGARLQGSEIAPRARLAEQLTPDLRRVEDLRQPPSLLRVRPVREQRRADQVDADAADELRRAAAGELLGDDVVLDGTAAATAVLLGPGHAHPAAARELRLPLTPERDLLGEVVEPGRQALAVLPREVRAQPAADLVAQREFGGGGGEVHQCSLSTACGARGRLRLRRRRAWCRGPRRRLGGASPTTGTSRRSRRTPRGCRPVRTTDRHP